MSPPISLRPAILAAYPHQAALAVQINRNVVVQALGVAMVSVVGLSILSWPLVAAWTLIACAVATAEDWALRRMLGDASRTAALWAPVLRVLATTVYAVAAFALFLKGGPDQRLFAFALVSASMVHVLMRYYRSPPILVASLTPYLIALGAVSFGLARAALAQGNTLAALAPPFALATFALQFWSARAQLAGAWNELMTARQEADERARAADGANRAKSQFLATMSHELRTPLNGVLGMTQALAADALTPVQRERVSTIHRSSESLLAVLNDLLDLSKIEAGSLELEKVEFDLERLVHGIAAAYQPLAAKKAMSFRIDVAGPARGRYLGDSARIRRVLYSLCDNAVKFTDDGGVTLRVERDADRVLFCVSDTGIGIARDDLAHLFEGFFQADATLSRRYGGTGAGLAICGQLAALMGGTIEASSKLGVGSTFTLALPLQPVGPTEAATVADMHPAEPESAAGLSVLAAEDNVTNQQVLRTLLALAGITPTLVENGREALAAWERQGWDVVLMDIQMPEMNGIEATRAIRLREMETGRPRTPIVAVTANAMTHQVVEYEAAGMDGVVAKPIDLANLLNAMEQALAQASAIAAELSQQTSTA
jgi:signal transduction histidine kinase/AmiR/NasT family two-component response regulator